MIITVTFNPSYDKTLEVRGFQAGQTVKARTLRHQPAGKGVNVSRCIAALGGSSLATGFLGRGEADAYARSFEGTDTQVDFVIVDGETRQNTTVLDPDSDAETHLREEGFTVTEDDVIELRKKLTDTCKQGDLVIFAGSLPPGMKPEHMALFVKEGRSLGCSVAVDTSGPALAAAVEADCSIIKPNLEELRELAASLMRSDADQDVSTEEGLRRVARIVLEQLKILLVTGGEEGAWCFTSDSAWKGSAKVKNVVNTVGAGDAFLAGFALSFVDGQPLNVCLRQAVAVGGASTAERWAGEVDEANVRRLAKKATVTELPQPDTD